MIKKNQIFSLLKKQYGIEKPKLVDLMGHIDNVFLVEAIKEKFVLKISMNRKMRDVIFRQQLDFINFLKKQKFNVPNIIKTKDGRNFASIYDYRKRNCVLFEYVGGASYEIKNDSDLNDFCHWLIDLHKNCLAYQKNSKIYLNPIAAEIKKSDYMVKYAKRYKKQYLQPLLDLQKRILSEYRKHSNNLKTAMLVNDLHETNIKTQNGKKIILDFNIAGKSYLVDELSWVLVWYLIQKNKIDKIGNFLKPYLKAISLNESELSLLKELPILFLSRLQFRDIEDMQSENVFLDRMKKFSAMARDFQKQVEQIV